MHNSRREKGKGIWGGRDGASHNPTHEKVEGDRQAEGEVGQDACGKLCNGGITSGMHSQRKEKKGRKKRQKKKKKESKNRKANKRSKQMHTNEMKHS